MIGKKRNQFCVSIRNAHKNLGDEYLRRLDFVSAAEAYRKAYTLDPNSATPLVKKDQLSLKSNKQSNYLDELVDFAHYAKKYGLFTTIAYQYQQRGELLISSPLPSLFLQAY